jgi:hypothetical protein
MFMGFFRWLRGGQESQSTTESFYRSLYPESVRYALAHNGALMGPSEIASLVDRFTYEALYLIIKAIEDREQKRQCIEALTLLFVDPDYNINALKDLLCSWAKAMPVDVRVKGTKLAQLSRSGSSSWQESFRGLAQSCYNEDKSALPCLIAHTAILGYQHFVQIYKDKPNTTLMVLFPEWMLDPDEEYMGFSVRLTPEVKVVSQKKDKCLVGAWACGKHECKFHHLYCGNSFFVDDTIHSGETAGKITSFWHSEYGLNIPDERVKVITDLREKSQ